MIMLLQLPELGEGDADRHKAKNDRRNIIEVTEGCAF